MMKILITNDDGISSRGLLLLAKKAMEFGEVTVAAPKTEQSGKSQSINIHSPFEAREVELLPGVRAYSVDSSPADCVRFAKLGLGVNYDLVLSGINNGLNIGIDMVYSGTVGAIFEANAEGMPAVALSTTPGDFDAAAAQLERVIEFFRKHKLLSYSPLYNVNIPPEGKDICMTHQGGRYYNDRFVEEEANLFRQHGYSVHEDKKDFTIDTDATLNGCISITPITLDRTDYSVLNLINSELKK